jgi:hypothetical protein
MPTVREQIDAARETLVRAGLAPLDASIDASVLARHALGWDRATLLARGRGRRPRRSWNRSRRSSHGGQPASPLR